MIMPNGNQVTERVRAEDEGYAARQAASKWGFKTWQCEYRFEALGEVIEEPDGQTERRPGAHLLGANTFDTPAAVPELEASGFERPHAEAIAKTICAAAGAGRTVLLTRGELHRALWVQTAIVTIIVTLLSQ